MGASSILVPEKPLLRGVIHQFSFFLALAAGVALVATAPPGLGRWTGGVYAASLAVLLGVSALYHRLDWRPRARAWMRRLDHSAIFLLIAGTYTPISLCLAHGRDSGLLVIWGCAAAGMLKSVIWPYSPKWVMAFLCVAMGWLGITAAPAVRAFAGTFALAALVAGGVLYSAGAVIYALKRPNPLPRVFGYHEVFHALVVAAAVCHFAAVAAVLHARA